MAVGVTAIRGGWGGLRPVLSLEGVSINDRAGRAAFRLERAEATLSWWSLFLGEIRFHDLDFHRPDLVLRRGADGIIYLADKPINAAGPGGDGAFTEWLLAQRRLGIHDATLTWRDDFGGAPEVRLAGVEIAVARSRGRHRAALTAVPPRSLATRIDLRTEVQLVREGDRWRARGEAYAEALNADLARLRNHLPVPETLRSGVGSARLWLAFDSQGITEATGDVNMRDARVQLDADALPLQLASLSGRAIYRADPEGFSLTTEQLRFRLASGAEASPGRFSVTRTSPPGAAPRVEFRADNIDLKIAATLVDYFPLPREIKGQVLRFAPRGRIADARIAWTEGAKAYSVNGRFEALAINAVDAYPGASGLSGSIEGTEAGGNLKLESRGAAFEAHRIFAAPLAFDQLEALARWRHVDSALEVQIERARVANADGTLEFAGTWRAAPPREAGPSPGIVDFKGTLERVVVRRVPAYLPNVIAGTREWLEKALSGGEVNAGRFELRGDLYDFPFGGKAPGRFLIEARARNGRLVYHPEWPSIDAIEGLVRFDNRSMEIRAQRGAIFSSAVRSASAVIADLGGQPAVLVIDGEVDTTGADAMRFLRESPLVNGPGAFTRAIAVEGPGRLKLHLDIPLRGADAIRVAGEYQFTGATATGGGIAMREVRGKLAFTERGVSAPEIVGTMFGSPATLALATDPGGGVLTTIEGRIDMAALRPYVPEPIAQRLSGSAQWKARVLSGAKGTEIGVASDLVGLASRLPAPLDKAADETRSLTIQLAGIGTETELVNAALSGSVFWRSVRRGEGEARPMQVAIKMGEPIAQEPARDGLWLYGNAESLDVDAWMAVFPEPARGNAPTAPTAQPLGLRGLDMRLGRVRYAGRELAKVAAKLEQADDEWRGTLDSPIIAGTVQWRSEGRGRLSARLSRLAIPEARPDAAASQAPSQDPPALDVVAERFDFRGRTLGKLEIKADYARPDVAGQASSPGEEWRIEKLDITSPHAQWRSTGSWRRTGAGALTSMTVALEVPSLNGLLGQFGYGDYVTRGTGRLEGKLAWPGHPHDFSTSILSGSLEVRAQRGQFAKLEPGAGKLLGLLSLQSLPRRVTLDFRDIFSDGFAFESIEGSVKIARGIMLTEHFAISGPSALVSLSGEVSLPQETQALTLRVVPEMGESAAVAATVLGTPVLGLSTLLISKLLSNPIGKVVAYEYLVTGSWDNPVVTKLSAPTPPPAKAATAEAQK